MKEIISYCSDLSDLEHEDNLCHLFVVALTNTVVNLTNEAEPLLVESMLDFLCETSYWININDFCYSAGYNQIITESFYAFLKSLLNLSEEHRECAFYFACNNYRDDTFLKVESENNFFFFGLAVEELQQCPDHPFFSAISKIIENAAHLPLYLINSSYLSALTKFLGVAKGNSEFYLSAVNNLKNSLELYEEDIVILFNSDLLFSFIKETENDVRPEVINLLTRALNHKKFLNAVYF